VCKLFRSSMGFPQGKKQLPAKGFGNMCKWLPLHCCHTLTRLRHDTRNVNWVRLFSWSCWN
jgi:hypothetical protein